MDLAILTPLDPRHPSHLREAARSVRATRRRLARDGITVTWIVVSGGHPVPPLATPIARAIRFGAGSLLVASSAPGPGALRGRALRAAVGSDLVFFLEPGDRLVPAGMARLATTLRDHEALSWMAGARRGPDGRRCAGWHGRERDWAPRELEERWPARPPFHVDAIMVRRTVARAVADRPRGACRDLAWLLSLATASHGRSRPVAVLHCRHLPLADPGGLPASEELEALGHIGARIARGRKAVGLPPLPRRRIGLVAEGDAGRHH